MSDRIVAVRLRPGPTFTAALDRAWAAGDAVLPVSPALPGAQMRRILDEVRPAVLIEADGERRLRGAEPVAADVALVVATSGSTGRPKGVELTHGALRAAVDASLDRLGRDRGDRWLCCLPTSHVAGLLVLLRARACGGEALVHPGFDVDAVAAERSATMLSLVPTMLARLLDAGVDLRRFRRILLGGAAAPAGLLARAEAAGARVVATYGMTETCGGCLYDGTPLDGVDVAVAEDGRLLVRGPMVMRGYRRRPALTEAVLRDGWLRTPDLGRVAPDGRVEVVGRIDDVIVTGAENVVAGEVAAVLADHPAVAEAAVIGVADPEWGQRVVAVCVPADPAEPPTLAALRAHVRRRTAPAAAPRQLVLVGALPRLESGKVDRVRVADSLDRVVDRSVDEEVPR